MLGNRSRSLVVAASAVAVLVVGLATPAFADDPPPLVWSTVSTTSVDGLSIEWQTASSTSSPFGGQEMLDPMPVFRPVIVNASPQSRFVGFGTDFTTQGSVGELWTSSAWGSFTADIEASGLYESFWAEIPAGGTLDDAEQQSRFWTGGMPSWSGHTITVFELDAAPLDGAVPAATPLASVSTPGRFVPTDLVNGNTTNLSAVLGQRATVSSGSAGAPELFAGVTATVEASHLTPGDSLELWIAEGLNYALFQVLGGGLPVGAIKVGEGTVAADGTLAATFTLPANLSIGDYQLVAGVRAERYWPAGSYDDFHVTIPASTAAAATPAGASTVPVTVGPTTVTLGFPAGTGAGTTSVTVSPTGPVNSGFEFVGDDVLYYHISSTATLGGPVTVCVNYAPVSGSGFPPRLYHFDTSQSRWFDITTTQSATQVCGLTPSFSPFALGYPPRFDFSGFFAPVSMDAENIAKPGQAVPVKFSLGGDQGLRVVTSARFVLEGAATTLVGEPLDTTAAGGSGLSYDARTGQYTYVWKTNKAWSLKSGRFELTLSDGTTHSFSVTFKK
ncbi:PxKF domain-containing protein [Microbacterium sp. AZCO]|uniref:PxKF domain-containing protein n=1 Tax=Microbacterium sp. AZCO TaxID=3142976 RepID=UPI0031F41C2C